MTMRTRRISRLIPLALLSLMIPSSHAAASGNEDETVLQQASYYLETGKPDSAAVLLYDIVDSLTVSPKREKGLYYLATACEQLGRTDEAKAYLSEVSESSSTDEVVLFARYSYARILYEAGDYEKAVEIARACIDASPASSEQPGVRFLLGNTYLARREYQRAFNIYSDIRENYPGTDAAKEAIVKEGICLFQLTLYSGAIERLEEYIRTVPGGSHMDEALYYAGRTYEEISQPEFAARMYQRLTYTYPSYIYIMDAYYRMGSMLYRSGEFVDAENAFLNYIENTDPGASNRDEALYYLERIKFRTGVYTTETDIAEHFVIKYPDSPRTPDLLFDLAMYYRLDGKPTRAIDKYRILLTDSLYVTLADSAAIQLARTYIESGSPDDAESFLRQRAYELPNSRSSQYMLFTLASLYEEREQYDAAIAWYDSSLVAGKNVALSARTLWAVGRCHIAIDRWIDAEKNLKRAVNDYKGNPYMSDIYLALSDLYIKGGSSRDAIAAAEQAARFAKAGRKTDILLLVAEYYEEYDKSHALQLYSLIFKNKRNSLPQRTRARMQYADLSLRMGDTVTAIDTYADIILNVPDSSTVQEARTRLNRINTEIE